MLLMCRYAVVQVEPRGLGFRAWVAGAPAKGWNGDTMQNRLDGGLKSIPIKERFPKAALIVVAYGHDLSRGLHYIDVRSKG